VDHSVGVPAPVNPSVDVPLSWTALWAMYKQD